MQYIHDIYDEMCAERPIHVYRKKIPWKINLFKRLTKTLDPTYLNWIQYIHDIYDEMCAERAIYVRFTEKMLGFSLVIFHGIQHIYDGSDEICLYGALCGRFMGKI